MRFRVSRLVWSVPSVKALPMFAVLACVGCSHHDTPLPDTKAPPQAAPSAPSAPIVQTPPPAPAKTVTGVWKLRLKNQEADAPPITLTLQAEGSTLTGTITGAPTPDAKHDLEAGKIEGDQLSFEVNAKEQDGSSQKTVFKARFADDQLTGDTGLPDGTRLAFTATRQSLAEGEETHAPSIPKPENAGGPPSGPPNPQGNDPLPHNAQQALLSAFDTYEVVGGLSPAEGSKDTDDFILALIRNPAFPDSVNDIALEHGNALYQPLLDRYIAGENVPLSEVRQVWRNTTQPPGGFALLYEELIPLVRRINQNRPAGKQLRVLACDPPVDWSKVKTSADLAPFEKRDAHIASVMEREVLAKHRKALMLFGVNHMKHGTGSAVGLYEGKYPNTTFVIAAHNGFGNGNPALEKYNDMLEKRMADWPVPSLVTMKGTWLADLSSAYFAYQEENRGGRGDRGIDGYLYLGPRDLLLNQPIPARIALDRGYMEELRRRATLLQGAMRPEALLQQERDASPFTYNAPVPGTRNH